MRWLNQQLFDQFTRLDPRPTSFFDLFRAMDPETRGEILNDAVWRLTPDGHIGVMEDGQPAGHFSLLLLWNHAPVPEGCLSRDLNGLVTPLETFDAQWFAKNHPTFISPKTVTSDQIQGRRSTHPHPRFFRNAAITAWGSPLA